MPLSTGATWPALKANFTAAAADMTAKFEWIEGHRYPMIGGELTSSVYDFGTSSYKWNRAYFITTNAPHVYIGNINNGETVRAWANVNVSSGTLTVADSFNVSSFTYNSAFPGLYAIAVTYASLSSTAYSMYKHTPRNSGAFISNLDFAAHRFKITNVSGVATDSAFSCVVCGPTGFVT